MARSADIRNSRGKAQVIMSTLGLRSQTLIRESHYLRASDADRMRQATPGGNTRPLPKTKGKIAAALQKPHN